MKIIQINSMNKNEIEKLSLLASTIVKEHYDPLLGSKQNDYMIEKFQSVFALTDQLNHGYLYYVIEDGGKWEGFFAIEPQPDKMYLSKFYINRSFRGNGGGRLAMNFIEGKCKEYNLPSIYLRVNRGNNISIKIYKHLGFVITLADKMDIGDGYFMDDYVMEKRVGEKIDQKERMLSGLPYKAWLDGLSGERFNCKKAIYEFNNLPPEKSNEAQEILYGLFGKAGDGLHIEAPFHCDYGKNIYVGKEFFANYNLVVLDVGRVIIGDNAMFGPNVLISTAGHPIHPDSRNSGYEYGIGITIGNNVWIGGNVSVLPDVTIGNNVVIGAGSVVNEDIPDNSVAVGNPCKVLRKITEDDRDFYFKRRKFDVEDYK